MSDVPGQDYETAPAAAGGLPKASEIEEKLKALFSAKDFIPAGRLQFLDLDPIKAEFGDRWPKVSERATAICKSVISEHLSRADLYIPIAELNFLMLFADLSEQEAEVKCGLIGSEIARHLLGESGGLQHFNIHTMTVDVAALRQGAGSSLDKLMRQTDGSAQGAAAGPPELADLQFVDGDTDTGSDWELVEFVFRPVWNVKQNALTTYICVPKVDRGPVVGVTRGYRILGDAPSPEAVAALDHECLRRVTSVLGDLEGQKQKLLVTCPVRYETLQVSRRRLPYLEQVERLTDFQRRLLVFEVAGLPEDLPQTRLLELLASLEPYSRARIVRVAIDRRDFSRLRQLHIHAVVTDLSDAIRPDRDLFNHFNRFITTANAEGLRTGVHGLSKLSLASAAVCAGFDYVDGDAVTTVTESPDNVYRFQSVDLFRSLGL